MGTPRDLRESRSSLPSGYAGVAVVLLAGLALAARPPAASRFGAWLVFGLVALNAAAWWIGRGSNAPSRRLLLVLGDALLPLNLWAVGGFVLPSLLVSGPGAGVVLATGFVAQQALGYRRFSRGEDPFLPFLLALSGALYLFLALRNLGLGAEAPWGMAALALVFQFAWPRAVPEEHRAFVFAGLGLQVATAAVTAVRLFGDRESRGDLALLYVLALSLLAVAIASRDLGPSSWFLGLAAYVALILAATGTLYSLQASAWIFLVATAAWAAVMTFLGFRSAGGRFEAFRDNAHWVATGLGAGVVLLAALSWHPPAGRVLPLLGGPGTGIVAPSVVLAIALVMALQTSWRRRNPTIADTLGGFVANTGLLHFTSFLAPVLLSAAATGLWLDAGGPPAATAAVPLVAGTVFLALPTGIDSLFPRWALRVIGYLSIAASAAIAWRSTRLVVAMLLASAAVFLWRSAREKTLLPHVSFLASLALTVGIVWARVSHPRADLALALLALGVLGVNRALLLVEGSSARTSLTQAFALSVGGLVLVRECLGGSSPVTVLVLGVGLLLILGGRVRPGQRAYEPDVFVGEWLESFGYILALASSVALLLAFLPLADAGPGLALWAWILDLAAQGVASRRPRLAATTRASVGSLAVLAVFLPLLDGLTSFALATASLVATLLLLAALYFDRIEIDKPWRWSIADGLVAAAILAGATDDSLVLVGALVGGALLYLWQSVRTRGLPPHAIFLALSTAAGIALVIQTEFPAARLALSVLSIGLLGLYLLFQAAEGRTTRARLTLAWALAVGWGAAGLDLVTARLSSWTFLPVWLGFLLALGAWQDPAEGEGRPRDPEDRWIAVAGFWLAHAAGAAWLLSVVRNLERPSGEGALALALWAWLHWGATSLLARGRPASPAAIGTRHAALLLSVAALWIAGFHAREGWPVVATACLTGLLGFGVAAQQGGAGFFHLGAASLTVAAVLLGLQAGGSLREFYLAPLAAYAYLVIWREADRDKRTGPPRWGETSLAAAALLLGVAYPAWALVRSGNVQHVYWLAGGSLVVSYGFPIARQRPVFLALGSCLFLIGCFDALATGLLGTRAATFLLAVGLLMTARVLLPVGRPLPSSSYTIQPTS